MPSYKFKGWQLFDYYQWLIEKVNGHMAPYYDYSLLLHELHSIPYTWALENDQNRAIDGKELRRIYMEEENISDMFYGDDVDCSVLEMMIALSIQCDGEIMWEPFKDHVEKWFWMMIDNLDLTRCTDDHFSSEYVHQQVEKWINRDFKRDGKGSAFPLNNRACRDQRKVTIWQQMCGYLSEHFDWI